MGKRGQVRCGDDLILKVCVLTRHRAYERTILNERPIFLRSNFIFLSLVQAAYHLFFDISRIKVPRIAPATSSETEVPVSAVPHSQRVRDVLVSMTASTATRAGIATFCNLFIYALFLRQSAYSWSRDVGRIIWNIPRHAEPSFVPPYHWTLLVRSFTSGTLMVFLWDFSNFVFSAYVAQDPIKKEKPLTEDSPDPNGSLLNGLQSKKELVRVCLFADFLPNEPNLTQLSRHSRSGNSMRSVVPFLSDVKPSSPTWTAKAVPHGRSSCDPR